MHHRLQILFTTLACLVVVGLTGCGSRSGTTANQHTVTYRVGGATTSANITYRNAQGGTEQRARETVPWEMTFTRQRGTVLYLSARNLEKAGGVSCDIVIDGVQAKHAESLGGFVVATCDGLVP